MTKKERCENCKFAVEACGYDIFCHKHAPAIPHIIRMNTHNELYGEWPKLRADNWCGDFILKENNDS